MGNKFLFLAYGFVWLIFMLYGWNLSRRQAQLKRDLEGFKTKIQDQSPSASRQSTAANPSKQAQAARGKVKAARPS